VTLLNFHSHAFGDELGEANNVPVSDPHATVAGGASDGPSAGSSVDPDPWFI